MPHTPLLIPEIGEEKTSKIPKSIKSWDYIVKKAEEIKPDKIILILPSYKRFNNISINQSEDFIVDFKDFGNLSVDFKQKGDLELSNKLKYFTRENNFPLNVFSKENVNYKAFSALYYLRQINSEFVILNSSNAPLDHHLQFGDLLNNFLKEEKSDIFVIACGDFANCNENKDSQAELKKVFLEILNTKDYSKIDKFLEDFNLKNFYGIKPFAIISSLIKNLEVKKLSLEEEFDETYLSLEFF